MEFYFAFGIGAENRVIPRRKMPRGKGSAPRAGDRHPASAAAQENAAPARVGSGGCKRKAAVTSCYRCLLCVGGEIGDAFRAARDVGAACVEGMCLRVLRVRGCVFAYVAERRCAYWLNMSTMACMSSGLTSLYKAWLTCRQKSAFSSGVSSRSSAFFKSFSSFSTCF